MKPKIVEMESTKVLIHESPGFAKKKLADYHIELLGLCQFGCAYCSSNSGNYLRINREKFAKETEDQLGERVLPAEDPALMFFWPKAIETLERQLAGKEKRWGAGKTLVFSQLTDGFSPKLVAEGITRRALDLLLEKTSFRIRILTKNAVVGGPAWTSYFAEHKGRFIVGLSIGTINNEWARRIEVGTSAPTARLQAHQALQAAGVPTYGMLCPVFPDAMAADRLEKLLDAIQPTQCETVWAEPYNDRDNWQAVRAGYEGLSDAGWAFMTQVYHDGERGVWSRYATDLYLEIRSRAARDGWLDRFIYLLYENDRSGDLIMADDAALMKDGAGILLQSAPGDDGKTKTIALRTIDQR